MTRFKVQAFLLSNVYGMSAVDWQRGGWGASLNLISS